MLTNIIDAPVCLHISQREELVVFVYLWIPIAILVIGSIAKYFIKRPIRAVIFKTILLILQSITTVIGLTASIVAFSIANTQKTSPSEDINCSFIVAHNPRANALSDVGVRLLIITTILVIILFATGMLSRLIREKLSFDEAKEELESHSHIDTL